MKEWPKKLGDFVEELKVTREMRKLDFPFQKDSLPFISKIRPQFLIITGAVVLVGTIGVAAYFFKKEEKLIFQLGNFPKLCQMSHRNTSLVRVLAALLKEPFTSLRNLGWGFHYK